MVKKSTIIYNVYCILEFKKNKGRLIKQTEASVLLISFISYCFSVPVYTLYIIVDFFTILIVIVW